MQADKLRELRELLSKATPGEWKFGVRRDESMWLSLGDPLRGPHYQGDLVASQTDAALIAAMHEALPALLALAEGAEADRADARRWRAVANKAWFVDAVCNAFDLRDGSFNPIIDEDDATAAIDAITDFNTPELASSLCRHLWSEPDDQGVQWCAFCPAKTGIGALGVQP